MTGRPYILDTNILLLLLRGGAEGRKIDERFSLRATHIRPLISIVTHGEIRVLASRRRWGRKKLEAMDVALRELVTLDIQHREVLDAYVAVDEACRAHPPGARNLGKNDLWIAACARAANAHLLTTDGDFEHLSPDVLEVTVVRFLDDPPVEVDGD